MFLSKSFIGRNRWYLYLAVLVVVFIATQIGAIPFTVYQIFTNGTLERGVVDEAAIATPHDSIGLALMLLSFAVGLGVLFLLARWWQKKRPTDITTGRSRFDWKRMAFGAAVWGLLTLSITMAQVSGDSDVVLNFDASKFFPLLVVGVIMFPLQTAMEEVLFRGYLMQGATTLFRSGVVALIATSLLFGLMHAANPEVDTYGFWVAMPQYVIMGLIMGYVTIKDDGIELALGMHFANNLLASLLVTSEGMVFQTAAIFRDTTPDVTHADTAILLAGGLVFMWICKRMYGFTGTFSYNREKAIQIEESRKI